MLKSGFLIIFHRKLEWAGRKGEGVNEGLNEGLKSLLIAIKENPGIKAKDLNVVLGIRPIKTIERQINILSQKNLIERRGSRKTGGYYLVDKDR